MLIIFDFCWIFRNILLQYSYYCEWFLYIAPRATPMQGTEEQVKKMIREVPREDSTALYITKIRGSPEAELEKKPSVHNFHHNAEILRNLKYHHCHFWNQESWRKKKCRRDLIKVQVNESLLWKVLLRHLTWKNRYCRFLSQVKRLSVRESKPLSYLMKKATTNESFLCFFGRNSLK